MLHAAPQSNRSRRRMDFGGGATLEPVGAWTQPSRIIELAGRTFRTLVEATRTGSCICCTYSALRSWSVTHGLAHRRTHADPIAEDRIEVISNGHVKRTSPISNNRIDAAPEVYHFNRYTHGVLSRRPTSSETIMHRSDVYFRHHDYS